MLLRKRRLELVFGLHGAALREALDFVDEAQRDRHAEVRFEQQLLEFLERTRLDATAREDGDVGERDVLDALPERALRDVAGFSKKRHLPTSEQEAAPAPAPARSISSSKQHAVPQPAAYLSQSKPSPSDPFEA